MTTAHDPIWHEGWYQFARHLRSPNFGPRPVDVSIDLILIHAISLPPGKYGGGEVQRLFTNRLDWDTHPYFKSIEGMQVSSHFYIARTGDLWQFVPVVHRAWHAGVSCHQGRDNCNDFSVGIELEGVDGGLFEAAQYESLGSLCNAIAQEFPIRAIAGHEHVAPGRKSDPGSGFNWLNLQHMMALDAQCFPADVSSGHIS
jgi:N-acetyl-anhydromuramoyl-L-alanine amidase